MNIINNIIASTIKKRIKSIDQSIQNPIESQNNILKFNIKYAKDTKFGEDHCFKKILNYSDYKNLIPIKSYDDILHYIKLTQTNKKIFYGQEIYDGLLNPLVQLKTGVSIFLLLINLFITIIIKQERTCWHFI